MTGRHLLVIDPQNDFCDPDHGTLVVPGADADMDRVAALLDRAGEGFDAVHVTLDSHQRVDISHPIWWTGAGGHPAPFTVITAASVADGTWTTTDPDALDRSLAYLRALEAGGRYPHVIWPYHCLIGDPGHNIWPALSAAIHRWEDRYARANLVTKGRNAWTEHFSAIRAEVPDPADPATQVDAALVARLEAADEVIVAGEALSHCVANTVRDLADAFADPASVRKLVLLTDAASPVPTFEALGSAFVAELTARGMRTATTADVA